MYENKLDIENELEEIKFLKEKGIIKEVIEEPELGVVGRLASINTKLSLTKTDTQKSKNIYYVVDVEKLIENPITGKGTWEIGDIYYIFKGDLYYKAQDKQNKSIGQVFREIEENISKIEWIYHENEDGTIVITGMDLSEFNKYQKSTYGLKLYLDIDKLVIPEEIDGKTVSNIEFLINDFVLPETAETVFGYGLLLDGIQTLVIPNSLNFGGINISLSVLRESITFSPHECEWGPFVFYAAGLKCEENKLNEKVNWSGFNNAVTFSEKIVSISPDFFDGLEGGFLIFNKGLDSSIQIPADKWGASSIYIEGVEYTN